MKSYCTRGILLLAVALLLLGVAACTQSKPTVPPQTLTVLQNPPALPTSGNTTPSAQGTAPAAVTTPGGTAAPGGLITPSVGGTEVVPPAAGQTPTFIPTPNAPAGGTEQPPVVAQPTAAAPSNPAPAGNCPNPYTVQRGEWLYQIARNCGVSPRDLLAANPNVNPNYLIPGQTLNIPGASTTQPSTGQPSSPSGRTYTVRRGDTMYSIAVRNGTTVMALMQANGISNPNFIYAGQVLVIP